MGGEAIDTATTVAAVARAVKNRAGRHHVSIFAAAIAFFAFLALVPTLTALLGIYGLASDPEEVTEEVAELLEGAPDATRDFIVDQMETIAQGTSGTLGLAVVLSIALALFSASGAMANLIKSLNVAYELEETRKPWTLRALALVMMIGAVIVLGAVLFLVHAVPPLVSGVGTGAQLVVQVLRFPLLAVLMAVSLSVLYRVGPDHRGNDQPLSPRLLTTGGSVATVAFVVLSILFSFYTANLGSYGETYGPLATIIVVLLWFQLSALSVVLGAEVDAELAERHWRRRTGLEDPAARDAALTATVERMLAAIGDRDPAGVLACWHRRGIEHHPLFGELAVPDQLDAQLTAMFGALPDLAIETTELSVDDTEGKAIVRYRLTGSFTGQSWDGVDANGRGLDIDVVCFLRIEDGFIVRSDVLFDTASVSSQLGFRPGERSRGRRLRAGAANLRTRWRNRRDGGSPPDDEPDDEKEPPMASDRPDHDHETVPAA